MNKLVGIVLVTIGVIWIGSWLLHSFTIGLMFIDIGIRIISHHLSIIVSILIIIFGFYIMKK
jgi:hypothetical protein